MVVKPTAETSDYGHVQHNNLMKSNGQSPCRRSFMTGHQYNNVLQVYKRNLTVKYLHST